MHVYLILAAIIAAIGAITDLRKGEIPNAITLVPLAGAPIAHAIHGGVVSGEVSTALTQLAYSIVGAVVCGLVPFVLWRVGAAGGGDVKILAALGALLMPMVGLEAQLYAFVAAALIAPARLAYQGKLWKTLGNSARLAINPLLPKSKRKNIDPSDMTWFRLGPAIFLGTLGAAVANWS